jgi:hypothetical protein
MSEKAQKYTVLLTFTAFLSSPAPKNAVEMTGRTNAHKAMSRPFYFARLSRTFTRRVVFNRVA